VGNIERGKMGDLSGFMANLPMMNRQAQLQSAQTYGGLGNQLMSVAPRSQTSNQYNYGTNTGTGMQRTTQNPSIMSDIGQAFGVAGGFMGMPGLSNFFGNQGQQYVNPGGGVNMPTFYGDQGNYGNAGYNTGMPQSVMQQLYPFSNQPQPMQAPPINYP
jgi:hypothetical protein